MLNYRLRDRKQLVANVKHAEATVKTMVAILDQATEALHKFDEDTSTVKMDTEILFDSIRDQKTSQAKYDLFNSILALMKRTTRRNFTVYRDRTGKGFSVKVDGNVPRKFQQAFARLADRVSKSEHESFYSDDKWTTTRYIFRVMPPIKKQIQIGSRVQHKTCTKFFGTVKGCIRSSSNFNNKLHIVKWDRPSKRIPSDITAIGIPLQSYFGASKRGGYRTSELVLLPKK